MVVSSGKQTLPFSLLACVITRANDQQGFQMLCVHFFLAGGFSSLKSTQNKFCFVWKPDLVWKCIISQVRKASPSKLWWLSFNGNLTNSTKKEAGSYLHEIYTFISEQTALMVVFSRVQPLPFSHLGLCYIRWEWAIYCQMLYVHWLFAGSFSSSKHTHILFYFVRKAELVWKRFVFTSGEKPHRVFQGDLHLMEISQTPHNQRLESSYMQSILYSVKKHQSQK